MSAKSGQAYLETLLVMLWVSLVFFGLFQLCLAFMARDILNHSAQRAARARTVGFNQWMVEKVSRVAAIPTAGAMIEPGRDTWHDPALAAAIRDLPAGVLWDRALFARPVAARVGVERARIPEYLAAPHPARARYILDYDGWNRIRHAERQTGLDAGSIVELVVRQEFPLRVPLSAYLFPHRIAADGDTGRRPGVSLAGRAAIEAHFPYYLDSRDW